MIAATERANINLFNTNCMEAMKDMEFDLELYEIDEEYYRSGTNRFNNHCKQGQLF